MFSMVLAILSMQPDDAQARAWAVQRGFEKVAEQAESNARDKADEFVLSIKDRPTLTNTWPAVGNGDLSYEVCQTAYQDELLIDSRTFLDRVSDRLKLSDGDRAALIEDCAVYYEGMIEGQKSIR